jgi:hypothetical protein
MMSLHFTATSPPGGAVVFTAKVPGDTAAVSTYYKRNVCEKIGDVIDPIMGRDGSISHRHRRRRGFLGTRPNSPIRVSALAGNRLAHVPAKWIPVRR